MAANFSSLFYRLLFYGKHTVFGKVVEERSIDLSETNQVQFSSAALRSGVYFVELSTGSKIETERVVIIH